MITEISDTQQSLYNKQVNTGDGLSGLFLRSVLRLRKFFKSEDVFDIRIKMEKQASKFLTPEKGTVILNDRIATVPVCWVNPNPQQKQAVIYLHGGAYVAGSVHTHAGLTSTISKQCGIPFLLVDYGLAPEYKFPFALHQVISVYKVLLSEGYDANHIAIAGDSAGGGLALSFLQYCRDLEIKMPSCAVFICPWLDLTNSGASFSIEKQDPMLNKKYLDKCAQLYAGNLPRTEKYLYPFKYSIKGLPPIYLHTAGLDVLQDDGKELLKRSIKENVPVYWYHHHNNFHVYHIFWKYLKGAREANTMIAKFLSNHIGH